MALRPKINTYNYQCTSGTCHGQEVILILEPTLIWPRPRVKWAYLEKHMLKMGFAELWINRVMQCVRSVSFSVKINGQYSDFFKPTSGIRQGDPISPCLLLLCANGLSAMLKFHGPLYLA